LSAVTRVCSKIQTDTEAQREQWLRALQIAMLDANQKQSREAKGSSQPQLPPPPSASSVDASWQQSSVMPAAPDEDHPQLARVPSMKPQAMSSASMPTQAMNSRSMPPPMSHPQAPPALPAQPPVQSTIADPMSAQFAQMSVQPQPMLDRSQSVRNSQSHINAVPAAASAARPAVVRTIVECKLKQRSISLVAYDLQSTCLARSLHFSQ
jgi:hypothetical protein